MTREEAIEILRDTPIDIRSSREDDVHTLYATAQMMAIEALKEVDSMIPLDGADIMLVTTEEYEGIKAQDGVENLTQDLADRLNDAYAKGYNAAKREIALSGEYERAYQRGIKDATKWIPCSERLPSDGGNYLITVADLRLGHIGEHTVTMADFYVKYKKWNSFVDVYAWMPTPEPYKPKEGE